MKPKRKKRTKAGEPQTITRAVTHIRLVEVNPGKLAALDRLAPIYLALCQQYVILFCTEELPNKLRAPLYSTPLSERWHRVAIMQAAGIALSWRTNRQRAYQDYLDTLSTYQEQQVEGTLDSSAQEPTWHEWNVPALREPVIQANANVVKLDTSENSTFDYWLTVSTLDKGKPIRLPVKLAPYHKEALKGRKINSSVQLNKRDRAWWLTLSYDELIVVQTQTDAPVVGIDVGIANFVSTSTGRNYGTFHGRLRERQKRDRDKRRRKAKLRACLKRKGKEKLPSTSSRSGQRLTRHVKHSINRAINQCFAEHEGAQFAYEQLSVASMRFKARAQNAYLRASNLAHLPKQIQWNALKRGVLATSVMSAYSSQECNRCFYTHRGNRPSQGTFRCLACGYEAPADTSAAVNIARRVGDKQLRACRDRIAVKSVLMKRHEAWKKKHGQEQMRPVKQGKRSVSSSLT